VPGQNQSIQTAMRPVGRISRTLHLVDLENLCGEHRFDRTRSREVLHRYLTQAAWRQTDHVILAAHPRLLAAVSFDSPVAMQARVAARGRDGADRTLLQHVTPAFAAARFAGVVIGSGDRAFAPFAAEVASLGCPVAVLAPPSGLSGMYQRLGIPTWTLRSVPEPDLATPANAKSAA